MNTDSYYSIGKTHRVCQDYARSGQFGDGRAFAAVSDGCSSSPDTDIGARLLVLSGVYNMQYFCTMDPRHAIDMAKAQRPFAEQTPETLLDATLLTAHVDPQGIIDIDVIGDGVVVILNMDSTVTVFDIDFGNAPGYLSYLIDAARWDCYVKRGWNKRTIRMTTLVPDWVPLEQTVKTEEVTLENFPWHWSSMPGTAEAVFLFTDGVKSFSRKTETGILEPVPYLDVVQEILKIKSWTGEFLTRRCSGFEKRFCLANQWSHDDDFGVAAVHLGNVI